jgi:hypothetical protein
VRDQVSHLYKITGQEGNNGKNKYTVTEEYKNLSSETI